MATKAEKLSLAFTAEHAAAIREAVESGDYATSSEVVREAMRLWTERQAQKRAAIERIGKLWDEGIASGTAGEMDIEAIIERAKKQQKKD
jgi:antitoxin ParD1/3/4